MNEPVVKICKACGQSFSTIKNRQIFCNQLKKKTCPICGSEFEYVCKGEVKETCGDIHCQAQLIKDKRTKSAQSLTKICKWCGKEFNPKDYKQVYCDGVHYKTCKICGKDFVINPAVDTTTLTCSQECARKLMSINHLKD